MRLGCGGRLALSAESKAKVPGDLSIARSVYRREGANRNAYADKGVMRCRARGSKARNVQAAACLDWLRQAADDVARQSSTRGEVG